MARSTRLTPLSIERAKPGSRDRWLSDDEGIRGGGRLVVRIGTVGSKRFYYRYSVDGRRHQVPIGPFCSQATEGAFTLEQARAVARSYAELHRRPESRNVVDFLAAEAERERAVREAAAAAVEAERTRQERNAACTLRALCDWYVAHLKAAGKVSAQDVRTIFEKNVYGTHWASQPAASLSAKDVAVLLRSVVERGVGRTAAKLRAYLRAAYALALKAELDPTAPAALMQFGVTHNPVADTAALSKFNKTRDRVLSDRELGAIWRHLTAVPANGTLALHAIRLAVGLGGQRPTQLLRVQLQDIDLDGGTITLLDPKGRRSTARRHVLPLVGDAVNVVRMLSARSRNLGSLFLFASGSVHLVPKTVSDASVDMVSTMLDSGEIDEAFQARDLRRSAETVLARLGVSKDVRAQLQSHGLGGVQQRHYDRHDYMAEKRAAIERWQGHLGWVAAEDSASRTAVRMA